MSDPEGPVIVQIEKPAIHSCPYCQHRGMQVATDLAAADGQVYGRCLGCKNAFVLPFRLDMEGAELRVKALREMGTY